MKTYSNAAALERDRFDVWSIPRGGRSWSLVLEAAPLREACAAVVRESRSASSVAFPFELETNPNRLTAHELAELAELSGGPIPDLLGGIAA